MNWFWKSKAKSKSSDFLVIAIGIRECYGQKYVNPTNKMRIVNMMQYNDKKKKKGPATKILITTKK